MSKDELRTLRNLYAAIQSQNAVELRGALSHDVELDLPATLPWGGVRHGVDGIETVLEIFLEHVEGSWADVDELLDAGDRIVVLGRARGRARTSGSEFEVPFAHVWGMADGVPAWCRGYLDTGPILAALDGRASDSKSDR